MKAKVRELMSAVVPSMFRAHFRSMPTMMRELVAWMFALGVSMPTVGAAMSKFVAGIAVPLVMLVMAGEFLLMTVAMPATVVTQMMTVSSVVESELVRMVAAMTAMMSGKLMPVTVVSDAVVSVALMAVVSKLAVLTTMVTMVGVTLVSNVPRSMTAAVMGMMMTVMAMCLMASELLTAGVALRMMPVMAAPVRGSMTFGWRPFFVRGNGTGVMSMRGCVGPRELFPPLAPLFAADMWQPRPMPIVGLASLWTCV